MARLFPPKNPSDAFASEQKVLSEFPNAYSVFNGVDWLNLNPRAKQRVGKTDLIILHPGAGRSQSSW